MRGTKKTFKYPRDIIEKLERETEAKSVFSTGPEHGVFYIDFKRTIQFKGATIEVRSREPIHPGTLRMSSPHDVFVSIRDAPSMDLATTIIEWLRGHGLVWNDQTIRWISLADPRLVDNPAKRLGLSDHRVYQTEDFFECTSDEPRGFVQAMSKRLATWNEDAWLGSENMDRFTWPAWTNRFLANFCIL